MVHSMSRHPTYLYSTYITLCVLSSICTKTILLPMYKQDSSSSAIGAAVCSDSFVPCLVSVCNITRTSAILNPNSMAQEKLCGCHLISSDCV